MSTADGNEMNLTSECRGLKFSNAPVPRPFTPLSFHPFDGKVAWQIPQTQNIALGPPVLRSGEDAVLTGSVARWKRSLLATVTGSVTRAWEPRRTWKPGQDIPRHQVCVAQMKGFFARFGGKKDRILDDASSSDLPGSTPHRGLLDRGLSTSSAASPAVPSSVRTRLHSSEGRDPDEFTVNPLLLDDTDLESSKCRGSLSQREQQQREKREQRRKEKMKRLKESQGKHAAKKAGENTKTRDPEMPGSPGSVTVGKRSIVSTRPGEDEGKERGERGAGIDAAASTSVASTSISLGLAHAEEFRKSQSEQEYFASLQLAMEASLADTNDTMTRFDRQGQGNVASSPAMIQSEQAPPSASMASMTFLPDTPSEAPDLQVARAMAESQFAARQADELQRSRNNLFDAAVTKAMEASMSTADYDHLLRDMKMWMIDLDATSDDVLSELTMVHRREEEIAGKIDKALEKGDTHRLTRLLWEQENLPEVRRRMETLQETMVPVAIASSDLMTLRQRILSSYPPIQECEASRNEIIEELFRSLKGVLRSRSLSGTGRRCAEGGASTSKAPQTQTVVQTSEECQDSSDLRGLITLLVGDAKKIPRAPDSVVKEAKAMVRNAFKEQQASINLSDLVAPDDSSRHRRGSEGGDIDSESKTEVSSIKSTATELQALIKDSAIDSGAVMGERRGRHEEVRGSSNKDGLQRMKRADAGNAGDPSAKQPMAGRQPSRMSGTAATISPRGSPSSSASASASATTVKPFNLSKSRLRTADARRVSKKDLPPIRRVPAFFSLTHELLTDNGIVSQSVNWESREYSIESFSNKYHTVPAPVNVDEFYSEDVHELLSYVKKHARSFGEQPKSANIPKSSKYEEKWYAMVEVAGAVEGLLSACETFLTWKLPSTDTLSDAISASCHSLKHAVNQTLSIIADTAYAHDTLRVAIRKHHLPWDENLISQVRWDAQHAASIIMQAAIDCADDKERKRGFKRSTTQKSVLKPLGQATIATFSVHQLSGGFGGEAALIADQLVDLCVHYARQLDPKWFRGTKVVS